jgi:hypothetical protein
MNGMLFATYHFFTKLQMRHDNDDAQDQQPTLGQIFLAGSYCGLASTYVVPSPSPHQKRKKTNVFHRLLTTPIELIKIQQQKQQQQQHLETGRASPASARAVALHVYRAGGIRALYHGLSATIWRDVGGFGLYFYGVRVCGDPSRPQRRLTHANTSTKARCASSRLHTQRTTQIR